MNAPKKTAINLSLFIIVLYWLYQLFVAKTHEILTTSFSDFVLRIVLTKSIHLVVIILLLRIEGERWVEMGFTFKNWKKQLAIGLLLGLILFLVLNIGLSSVLNSVFPKPAGSASILAYFNEPRNIYIWLLVGIFGGGFVEELMRIFVLTRFEKKLRQPGLYFALVCSSLVFGIGHLYQGVGTAVSTGISGLVLASIYIKRRSAIEVITIHAFSDVLSILGAYQLANHP